MDTKPVFVTDNSTFAFPSARRHFVESPIHCTWPHLAFRPGTVHGFSGNIIQSERVTRARVGADGVHVRIALFRVPGKREVFGISYGSITCQVIDCHVRH